MEPMMKVGQWEKFLKAIISKSLTLKIYLKSMRIDRDTAEKIAFVQMYIFHVKDVYIDKIQIRNFRDKIMLRKAYNIAQNYFSINRIKVTLG
jgi:hypothetical protein